METGTIWEAVEIEGLTGEAISCWPYPESNPDRFTHGPVYSSV
jgi:hypothetical protein